MERGKAGTQLLVFLDELLCCPPFRELLVNPGFPLLSFCCVMLLLDVLLKELPNLLIQSLHGWGLKVFGVHGLLLFVILYGLLGSSHPLIQHFEEPG